VGIAAAHHAAPHSDQVLQREAQARQGSRTPGGISGCGIGRGLGSSLLGSALRWLRDERGRTHAEYTSTSGLDDYDPLIYLSTVGTGAFMKGEFLDCVKTQFGDAST
jgi:hypothetical protein